MRTKVEESGILCSCGIAFHFCRCWTPTSKRRFMDFRKDANHKITRSMCIVILVVIS